MNRLSSIFATILLTLSASSAVASDICSTDAVNQRWQKEASWDHSGSQVVQYLVGLNPSGGFESINNNEKLENKFYEMVKKTPKDMIESVVNVTTQLTDMTARIFKKDRVLKEIEIDEYYVMCTYKMIVNKPILANFYRNVFEMKEDYIVKMLNHLVPEPFSTFVVETDEENHPVDLIIIKNAMFLGPMPDQE